MPDQDIRSRRHGPTRIHVHVHGRMRTRAPGADCPMPMAARPSPIA